MLESLDACPPILAGVLDFGGVEGPYLLLDSLLPNSWEGDPVPIRGGPPIDPMLPVVPGAAKGERAFAGGGSMGDVLAVDEPDRGCGAESWGIFLRFR